MARWNFCECGCARITQSRFAPGHDAKLKSRLMKMAAAGDQWATEELERRGWTSTDQRKFGVEIEFFGCTPDAVIAELQVRGIQCTFEGYTHTVLSSWKIVTDGSVNSTGTGLGSGLELVSPPLKGKAGLEELRKVCEALDAVGAKVDKTCGLHVHHDANDLNIAAIKRVVRIYSDNTRIIERFLAPSRRTYNVGTIPIYCGPITEDDMTTLDQLTNLQNIGHFIHRYKVVNLNSYPKYGTVELRQHQGTIEFEKISN